MMDTLTDIDLRSTMDIQITALEWMPVENGYLKYYPDEDKDVFLEQCADGTLKSRRNDTASASWPSSTIRWTRSIAATTSCCSGSRNFTSAAGC